MMKQMTLASIAAAVVSAALASLATSCAADDEGAVPAVTGEDDGGWTKSRTFHVDVDGLAGVDAEVTLRANDAFPDAALDEVAAAYTLAAAPIPPGVDRDTYDGTERPAPADVDARDPRSAELRVASVLVHGDIPAGFGLQSTVSAGSLLGGSAPAPGTGTAAPASPYLDTATQSFSGCVGCVAIGMNDFCTRAHSTAQQPFDINVAPLDFGLLRAVDGNLDFRTSVIAIWPFWAEVWQPASHKFFAHHHTERAAWTSAGCLGAFLPGAPGTCPAGVRPLQTQSVTLVCDF